MNRNINTYGILVDVTKCTGCEKCVHACIKANGLNPGKADYDRAVSKDGLSDNRFLSIVELKENRFARKSCMHCIEPSCVSACLVGGLTKTKEGAVVYDADKCIGCRYCMLSCPYGIPRYEWSKPVPFIKKCTMCYERLQKGSQPACVQACPYGAITFGNRNDLLRKAKSIVNNNSNYMNHVWGEKEFGGSSVMYISDTDLSKIGFKGGIEESIPDMTVPLMEKTPVIGGSVAASLIGLTWLFNRKKKIAEEKNTGRQNDEGGSDGK